ncbi:MAG: hypothetical protein WAS21_13895 [Geminicoccaceae bacterium]
MPHFFVPPVEPEKGVDAYQQLCTLFGANAVPVGDRIYLMNWSYDNVV